MALPVHNVTEPAVLRGQPNGRLPDAILVDTPGQAGGPTVRLVAPAARAWRALCAAALDEVGVILKASGPADSYRPLEVQDRIFRQRYTTDRLPGRPSRQWNGRTWWQRPGTAAAAVPGTSNHGRGLAVDVGVEADGDTGTESIDAKTVAWLTAHAARFGFSAELQSEPWHWRYYTGDAIPAAVTAHDASPDQEDDLLMFVAKSPDDAYAATVRRLFLDLLLREPSLKELGDRVAQLKADGLDAVTARLADSAEGKAVTAGRRRAAGVPALP